MRWFDASLVWLAIAVIERDDDLGSSSSLSSSSSSASTVNSAILRHRPQEQCYHRRGSLMVQQKEPQSNSSLWHPHIFYDVWYNLDLRLVLTMHRDSLIWNFFSFFTNKNSKRLCWVICFKNMSYHLSTFPKGSLGKLPRRKISAQSRIRALYQAS